ncbi:hypothetical protein GCM10028775_46430 [Catellatospora paridis]
MDDADLITTWQQAQAVATLLNLADGIGVNDLFDDRHVIE